MGQRKFTLYKDIKIGRGWQKAKAAFYSNGKIKPNIIIYKGKEQEHPEGAYYVNDRGKWIFAGKDALKAQRFRAELLDRHEVARLEGVRRKKKAGWCWTNTFVPIPNSQGAQSLAVMGSWI